MTLMVAARSRVRIEWKTSTNATPTTTLNIEPRLSVSSRAVGDHRHDVPIRASRQKAEWQCQCDTRLSAAPFGSTHVPPSRIESRATAGRRTRSARTVVLRKVPERVSENCSAVWFWDRTPPVHAEDAVQGGDDGEDLTEALRDVSRGS